MRCPRVVDQIVETLRPQVRQRLAYTLDERIEGADFAGVELQGDGLLPRVRYQVDDLLGFCLIGVVGKDRIDSALGEAQHSVAAQTTATTRDERDSLG